MSMKIQECSVVGLALGWAMYLAGLVYLGCERHWVGGLIWLAAVPCIRLAMYRLFPNISRFLGYGRVDDKFAERVTKARVIVTFYGFFSCPFCPIVLKRLEALQMEMGFTLEKIDVTLKPNLLMSKRISSVPVVVVGKNRLVGNATSEQLAGLIGVAAAI